ncbi:MAG: hypothetical protein KQI78_22225 [Deltaproteobacteria bacterium]|nr:hypothetical protein [Deltaproteobacteria bacterium]
MPTVIIMLFMTAVLATGCAPKIAPYLPDYATTHHYPAEQQTLQTDRPLLDVRYQYTLPVYTPIKEYQPPRPAAYPFPPLRPGQKWIAFDTLEQDILILHPPNDYSQPSKSVLGLAIYRDGRLYTSHPWYDRHRRKKISQLAWEPTSTPLFQPDGVYVVDCFKLDLVYRGNAGTHLLFEERALKCSSAVPVYIEPIYRPSQGPSTLYFQRLRVDLQPDDDGGTNRVWATVNQTNPNPNNN